MVWTFATKFPVFCLYSIYTETTTIATAAATTYLKKYFTTTKIYVYVCILECYYYMQNIQIFAYSWTKRVTLILKILIAQNF